MFSPHFPNLNVTVGNFSQLHDAVREALDASPIREAAMMSLCDIDQWSEETGAHSSMTARKQQPR